MEKNIPDTTSVQTIAFRSRDRLGAENRTRAKIYGKRFDDGLRRVLMRFYEPADVRGAALLILEKEDRNDMFLYTPELRKTRRVSARNAGGSLFGTDFSYEDFERLQGLHAQSKMERRPDAELDGRPVYVIAAHHTPEDESAYETIISFIDRESCLPLKIECYETGGRLRKLITLDPTQILQKGGIWVPQEVRVKDLRDETESRLIVEEITVNEPLPDKRFRIAELGRHRD
jgi:outer membrane lipoprotein-sorting protein